MDNPLAHGFPRAAISGSADLRDGKIVYNASATYEDAGPILDTLRRLIAAIEADDLPGEIERIDVNRFEAFRKPGGEPVYRYDVDIGWSVEGGEMSPDLRARILGRS